MLLAPSHTIFILKISLPYIRVNLFRNTINSFKLCFSATSTPTPVKIPNAPSPQKKKSSRSKVSEQESVHVISSDEEEEEKPKVVSQLFITLFV